MDPQLLVGLAALCAALTLAISAVAVGADDRQRVQRSLAAVAATRIGGARVLEPEQASFADRVIAPTFGLTARIARRLSPAGIAATLQRRLDFAGNPAVWSVERVLSLKGFGLLIGGLLGWTVGSGPLTMLLTLCFGACGFYLPDILVYNVGLKRQEQIKNTLPDSMDLLTISVEAGLGFDAALSQVAKNTDGPLAGEFFRVLQEMQIGKSRGEAFRSLAERTSVGELRAFVSSLVQADQFGIPIANVLREQSKELRVKRRQRAEERAQKVPVKIMVPLVLFIFPVIFIVVLGPSQPATSVVEAMSAQQREPQPADQLAKDERTAVPESLEFLLATRIRYELHQRSPVLPEHREATCDAEDERADPEPDLRAAEFLLATRALREANERALRPGAPDAPPP